MYTNRRIHQLGGNVSCHADCSRNDDADEASLPPVDSPAIAADIRATTTGDVIVAGDRKKKSRTVFSRWQVRELETTFAGCQYLSSAERCRLAGALRLSDTQVKIWFQNRRNKWKRKRTTAAHAHMLTPLGAPAGEEEGSAWNGGGVSPVVGLMSPTADKQSRRPPEGDTARGCLLSPAVTLPMYYSLPPVVCPLTSLAVSRLQQM